MPAYGIPQSIMYGQRGMGADGSMIRNRSMEQQNTQSGNPNLPMFNTAPSPPAGQQMQGYGSMPPGTGAAAYGAIMPQLQYGRGPGPVGQPQTGVAPGGGPPPPNAQQQAQTLSQFGPQDPVQNQRWQAARQAALARAGQPLNPSPGSAAGYNFNYNTAPGQSPFMPAFRGGGNVNPPVTVPNPVNS